MKEGQGLEVDAFRQFAEAKNTTFDLSAPKNSSYAIGRKSITNLVRETQIATLTLIALFEGDIAVVTTKPW